MIRTLKSVPGTFIVEDGTNFVLVIYYLAQTKIKVY